MDISTALIKAAQQHHWRPPTKADSASVWQPVSSLSSLRQVKVSQMLTFVFSFAVLLSVFRFLASFINVL